MEHIFYWTGVLFWMLVGVFLAGIILASLHHWYDRELSVTLKNLRFVFFGKSRINKKSYYEIWVSQPRWRYRYCTRGRGNKNFARLAMKRLVHEARKELLRGRPCFKTKAGKEQ